MKYKAILLVAVAMAASGFLVGCGSSSTSAPTVDNTANIVAALKDPCFITNTYGLVADQSKYTSGDTTVTTNAYYNKGLSCKTTCTSGTCSSSTFTYTPVPTSITYPSIINATYCGYK